MTDTAPQIGTVTRIPIADFIVDANIRKDANLTKTFTSSVKQHGVIVPIDAHYGDDNKWHVDDGQRRYLAALDAGHTDLPVIVGDPATAEARRVERQLVVNEHREQLTDTDRQAAYQTLFDLGVSPAQVAKHTNTPVARLEKAKRIAQSPAAQTVLQSYPITLEQAAALADYEDDPEDIAKLTAAAPAGRFDHVASEIRNRRAETAIRKKLEQELTDAGIPTLEEAPQYNTAAAALTSLYTDKVYGTNFTAETHASCPGHAGYVYMNWQWGPGNERIFDGQIRYACTDPKKYGHIDSRQSSTSTAGPLTDEEKAQRKLARENNKLWSASTDVRRAFITELIQGNEAPAGWQTVVARAVVRGASIDYRTSSLVETFLGSGKLIDWLGKNPARSPQLLLALAAAYVEGEYDYGKKGWASSASKDWLLDLSKWGYALSELEERVVAGTAGEVQV